MGAPYKNKSPIYLKNACYLVWLLGCSREYTHISHEGNFHYLQEGV